MWSTTFITIALLLATADSMFAAPQDPNEIIALERVALDRWGRGDPNGYLEIYADEVTYFAPDTEKRFDGLPAMRNLLLPKTGTISIDRYEMINPIVQFHGGLALLSFNIVNYQRQPNGSEQLIRRWNVTEAYSRVNGRWRIVHSHFSYVQPELKQPARVE
jgi:ketosteroid isomerase-like protein